MSSWNEYHPLAPSLEKDSSCTRTHIPQDLVYTTMSDYHEAYRGYDETVHDFYLAEDAQTIDDVLEEMQSEGDEDDIPGQYGTSQTMPEQHQTAAAMRDMCRYALLQTPAQVQQLPHLVPRLPNIVVSENMQPRTAAPARPVTPVHISANSQRVHRQRSGTGSMYRNPNYRVPHRQPRYHADLEIYNDYMRSGGRLSRYDRFPAWTTDGTRGYHSAAPRNNFAEYEYNYNSAGAGDGGSTRAFEALSEAFALTRKIDIKMVALKAVLTEVLFGEFSNTH